MTKFIFVIIVFLLFIWRIKKGFYNGIMEEVVTILSGVTSLISVALVCFIIISYREKSLNMFVLCVISLVVLGTVFKLCSLMFRPILTLSNISVIGGVNKLMGAVIGAVEAAVLSCLIYYILDYMNKII